ncbi:MAG: hypothetical protein LBM65_05480, partial [Oscillospiraceae bacterium]|nr:hypothetical protein [Oscillospiraceae bacterium]
MCNKLMKKRTLLIKVAAFAVVAVLAATLFAGCSANGNSGQTPVNQNNNNAQGVQTPVGDNSESEKLEEIVIEAKNLDDKYYFPSFSGGNYGDRTIKYTYLGIEGAYWGDLENGVPNGSGSFFDSYEYIGDKLSADGNTVALGMFENGHLVEGELYDYKGGTYEGHFSNDKPNGYGELTINDVEYVGDFVDGDLTIGVIYYDVVDVYLGEISNLQPNGYGTKRTVKSNLNGTDVTRESSFTDSGYYQNGKLVRAIAMPSEATNSGNNNSNNSGNSGSGSIEFNSGSNSGSNLQTCYTCGGDGKQQCTWCNGLGREREWVPGIDVGESWGVDGSYEYVT